MRVLSSTFIEFIRFFLYLKMYLIEVDTKKGGRYRLIEGKSP